MTFGVSFASAIPVASAPPAAPTAPAPAAAAAASPVAALRARKEELDEAIDAAAEAGDFAKANGLMAEQKEVEAELASLDGGEEDAAEAAKRAWLAKQEANK